MLCCCCCCGGGGGVDRDSSVGTAILAALQLIAIFEERPLEEDPELEEDPNTLENTFPPPEPFRTLLICTVSMTHSPTGMGYMDRLKSYCRVWNDPPPPLIIDDDPDWW